MSKAAQEADRAAFRAEVQSAAPTPASYTPRPESSKAVKVYVPTFDGKELDSMVFWIREIELSAGQIHDVRSQVAFALSNLGGRARASTMAKETATSGYIFLSRGSSWRTRCVKRSCFPMWRTAIALCSCGASKSRGPCKTMPWNSEIGGCHGRGSGTGVGEGRRV